MPGKNTGVWLKLAASITKSLMNPEAFSLNEMFTTPSYIGCVCSKY